MKEITLPQITKTAWILIAIVFLSSLLMRNLSITSGIVIGSLLGLLNFKALTLTTQKAIKSQKAKLFILSSYFVRLTIIGLLLAIILQIKVVNFIAVIVGLSIIIVAIWVEGMMNVIRGNGHQPTIPKEQ